MHTPPAHSAFAIRQWSKLARVLGGKEAKRAKLICFVPVTIWHFLADRHHAKGLDTPPSLFQEPVASVRGDQS